MFQSAGWLMACHEVRRRMKSKLLLLLVVLPALVGNAVIFGSRYLNVKEAESGGELLVSVPPLAVSVICEEQGADAVSMLKPILARKEVGDPEFFILSRELNRESMESLETEFRGRPPHGFVVLLYSARPASVAGERNFERVTVLGTGSESEIAVLIRRMKEWLVLMAVARPEVNVDHMKQAVREADAKLPNPRSAQFRNETWKRLYAHGPTAVSFFALVQLAIFVAMQPLFSGIKNKGVKSRLEVELAAMGPSGVLKCKLFPPMLLGMLLVGFFTVTVLLPAVVGANFPLRTAAYLFLWSAGGVVLVTPICLICGVLGTSNEQPSPLQGLQQSTQSIVAGSSALALFFPGLLLFKVLSFVPLTAPVVLPCRSLMVDSFEWWEIPASIVGLVVGLGVMLLLARRALEAAIATRDDSAGAWQLLKVLINPKSGT